MKKVILTAFTATTLLLPITTVFAAPLTISLGIPQEHTFSENNEDGSKIETDGSSGYFLGVSFLSFGLGIDSYTTKFKTGPGNCNGCWGVGGDAGLKTNMTNLFYQLPVPVVNLIIGLGMGTQEMDCTICSRLYDKGSATQWYTSIGLPIIPFFDIHLSYRSVTSKNITYKSDGVKDDNSGSVTGLGLAFNF